VTEANIKRLREGMTREEVKALFGEPARESEWRLDDTRLTVRMTVWEGPAYMALVSFGPADRVDWFTSAPVGRFNRARRGEPSGPLARLRAWLGW
jgi:hypothetical protein